MYEKERALIRILSNIADAQRLCRARDLLRQAEHEFKVSSDWFDEIKAEAAAVRLEKVAERVP